MSDDGALTTLSNEDIERVRQQVMRLRELLTLIGGSVAAGERAYARLFAACSDDDRKTLGVKQLQGKVAVQLLTAGDLVPLREAVLALRLEARSLERSFEEVYDLIVS
jgi:hypothetical protein